MHSLAEWFAQNLYWNVGANIIQWSTILFWGAAISGYWVHRSCKARGWCWRPGDHEVEGTTKSVCSVHHTVSEHSRLFLRHERKGDKLAHGESLSDAIAEGNLPDLGEKS